MVLVNEKDSSLPLLQCNKSNQVKVPQLPILFSYELSNPYSDIDWWDQIVVCFDTTGHDVWIEIIYFQGKPL